MEGLLQSHGGSKAFCLELMRFQELGSAVSVDLSIMSLTSFALYNTSSLSLIKTLEPGLVLDCGSLHLVPSVTEKGSMVIFGVLTNLIIGEGQFEYPLHYC